MSIKPTGPPPPLISIYASILEWLRTAEEGRWLKVTFDGPFKNATIPTITRAIQYHLNPIGIYASLQKQDGCVYVQKLLSPPLKRRSSNEARDGS